MVLDDRDLGWKMASQRMQWEEEPWVTHYYLTLTEKLFHLQIELIFMEYEE